MSKHFLTLFSSLALTFGGLWLATPRTAHAVDVMAPYWAYELKVGMRLAELRTMSGVTYRKVRIEAMTTVQMQFSHAGGVQVELLTNIIDPNQYLAPPVEIPERGAGSGSGGRDRRPQ